MEFGPVKMKRCKACKSWAQRQFIKPDIMAERPPSHPVGDCRHVKLLPACRRFWPEMDGAMDADTCGGIITGPDFCCIHWEDEHGNRIPGVDA